MPSAENILSAEDKKQGHIITLVNRINIIFSIDYIIHLLLKC